MMIFALALPGAYGISFSGTIGPESISAAIQAETGGAAGLGYSGYGDLYISGSGDAKYTKTYKAGTTWAKYLVDLDDAQWYQGHLGGSKSTKLKTASAYVDLYVSEAEEALAAVSSGTSKGIGSGVSVEVQDGGFDVNLNTIADGKNYVSASVMETSSSEVFDNMGTDSIWGDEIHTAGFSSTKADVSAWVHDGSLNDYSIVTASQVGKDFASQTAGYAEGWEVDFEASGKKTASGTTKTVASDAYLTQAFVSDYVSTVDDQSGTMKLQQTIADATADIAEIGTTYTEKSKAGTSTVNEWTRLCDDAILTNYLSTAGASVAQQFDNAYGYMYVITGTASENKNKKGEVKTFYEDAQFFEDADVYGFKSTGTNSEVTQKFASSDADTVWTSTASNYDYKSTHTGIYQDAEFWYDSSLTNFASSGSATKVEQSVANALAEDIYTYTNSWDGNNNLWQSMYLYDDDEPVLSSLTGFASSGTAAQVKQSATGASTDEIYTYTSTPVGYQNADFFDALLTNFESSGSITDLGQSVGTASVDDMYLSTTVSGLNQFMEFEDGGYMENFVSSGSDTSIAQEFTYGSAWDFEASTFVPNVDQHVYLDYGYMENFMSSGSDTGVSQSIGYASAEDFDAFTSASSGYGNLDQFMGFDYRSLTSFGSSGSVSELGQGVDSVGGADVDAYSYLQSGGWQLGQGVEITYGGMDNYISTTSATWPWMLTQTIEYAGGETIDAGEMYYDPILGVPYVAGVDLYGSYNYLYDFSGTASAGLNSGDLDASGDVWGTGVAYTGAWGAFTAPIAPVNYAFHSTDVIADGAGDIHSVTVV